MAGHTINVSVLADTKQFSSGLKGVSRELSGFGRSLQTLGGGIKGIGTNLTKYITAPAIGAAAAGAGIVAAFGWKRLVGLDTAKGQLKGLGYEGQDLQRIMDGVGKGVTDTTLSMADGTSIMVGGLATGNLALADTESYVRRVANVSAAYNVDAAHAGRLLNNVLTKNKVTWGDLSQMQENNIPIVTALADHYGVAGDEIEGMAQRGEISIEDLNAALDSKAGAAAEAYAETWSGVTENIMSNIGKIGAALLGASFEQIKEQAQTFLDLLRSDAWMEFATTLGEHIGSAISTIIEKVTELIEWWQGLDDGTKNVILGLVAFAVAVGPILVAIGSIISSIGGAILWMQQMHQAFTVLKGAMTAFSVGPALLVIAAIAAIVAGLIWFFTQTETGQAIWAVAWAAIKDAAAAVADWFVNVAWPAIQSAWEGIQAAAQAAADWFMTYVAPVISAAMDLVMAIFERLQQAWDVAWGAIQAVWAAIGPPLMAAISTAITVLSGVWKVIWTNMKVVLEAIWKTMKTVVQTALRVLESVIKAVTSAIKGDWSAAWGHIKDALSRAWEGIKSVTRTATAAMKTVVTNAMNAIKSAMDRVWSNIKTAVTNAWNNVKSTTTTKINEVVGFVRDMPGKIVSALGDLSGLLTGAARQVIDGFIGGLRGGFDRVKSELGRLTNLLPSWKGPASRDRNILKDSGHLVIDGFIEGLEDRYGDVRRSLRGLTKDVADTEFESPDAPGPTPRDARFPRSARASAAATAGAGNTEIHVHLEVEDLAAIRTVEDFLSMIDVRRRMAVGAT